MAWTCPQCHRQFRNKNQAHSCALTDPDTHFLACSPQVEASCRLLLDKVKEFGRINITSVKNAILISSKSTFLAIKTKKDHAGIEFLLDHEISEFPINKTFRVSRSRVAHFIRIGEPGDVDEQLMRWIRQAYDTVNR